MSAMEPNPRTPTGPDERPVALVTGVGRTVGIGAGIALELARTGWDLVLSHWSPYDARMPWGRQEHDAALVAAEARRLGARVTTIEADLTDPTAPGRLLDEASRGRAVRALVLSHAESVDSSLMGASVEAFDRHVAVNARASWLIIRAFARQFPADWHGLGRIVALTSDHTVGNMPYGASKGALDRIVTAAARELAGQGIAANAVNPGPVDTGWMDDQTRDTLRFRQPWGRLGTPADVAGVVAFLLSGPGGWINGQLLHADGGFSAP
jgi:3-oxoacyl-[acyl-carrier protein] reductase